VKKQRKRNYINNRDFFEAVKAHIKACRKADREKRERPRAPEYIGKCILQICNRLAMRPNFFSYTWREEMICDAIENCIVAIPGYNIKKENPFAYFSMIAWNAMVRRIQKEKKETYLKHKNMQQSFIFDANEFGLSSQADTKSEDVIKDFEDKLEANRKKKKKAAIAKKRGVEQFGD
jgi:DNA-directed RNA polymerase specialized sigma24 family protein